jgi:transposase
MKAKQNNKKVIMWYKVNELNSKGLNKSQISRELGIDRATVRKYINMNESEFYQWIEQIRCMPNKLQAYYEFIKNLLEQHSYLSASQIEDRLKECYSEPPLVHSKTIYNFVQKIRRIENIKKMPDHQPRKYQKLAETDYGHQAQADFGEYYIQTKDNSRKKVHFMVFVLCRSRYKYVFFQDKPFTSKTCIIAHEKCLQYFGGQPQEILYDQDRVLIVNENLGDVLLTQEFSSYCNQMDFKPVFCRKSDPESKGKVENVVGFVKKNFLRGRIYNNIDNLNASALAWLERTGNGKEHAGIKKIPSQEFIVEQPYLKPLKPGIIQKDELKRYRVRKDNTISYKSNFYTLPLGTYTNADTWVLLEVIEDTIYLYTTKNELLTTHHESTEKGSVIRNTDHSRDKSQSLSVLKEAVLMMLNNTERSTIYIEQLEKDKSRYLRDNLLVIERKGKEISSEHLLSAVGFCLENSIFNAYKLIEIANHYQRQSEQESTSKYFIPEIKSDVNIHLLSSTIQTSKISNYETIM